MPASRLQGRKPGRHTYPRGTSDQENGVEDVRGGRIARRERRRTVAMEDPGCGNDDTCRCRVCRGQRTREGHLARGTSLAGCAARVDGHRGARALHARAARFACGALARPAAADEISRGCRSQHGEQRGRDHRTPGQTRRARTIPHPSGDLFAAFRGTHENFRKH